MHLQNCTTEPQNNSQLTAAIRGSAARPSLRSRCSLSPTSSEDLRLPGGLPPWGRLGVIHRRLVSRLGIISMLHLLVLLQPRSWPTLCPACRDARLPGRRLVLAGAFRRAEQHRSRGGERLHGCRGAASIPHSGFLGRLHLTWIGFRDWHLGRQVGFYGNRGQVLSKEWRCVEHEQPAAEGACIAASSDRAISSSSTHTFTLSALMSSCSWMVACVHLVCEPRVVGRADSSYCYDICARLSPVGSSPPLPSTPTTA